MLSKAEIKVLKDISSPDIVLPSSLRDSEIRLFIFKIFSHIKELKFIQIAITSIFAIN